MVGDANVWQESDAKVSSFSHTLDLDSSVDFLGPNIYVIRIWT